MPIAALAPVCARMLSASVRAVAALAGAMAVGYGFGFRLHGWVHDLVAFVGIALVLSLALSLGADAMGSVAGNTEAAGQTLLVPQLLLVMLSTGIAPAQAFPAWLGLSFATSRCRSRRDAARAGCGRSRPERRELGLVWGAAGGVRRDRGQAQRRVR